jgi:hypothetical protein
VQRRHSPFTIALLALFILGSSCGQKGAPVVPETAPPPSVRDLHVALIGDKLQLTWTMPKQGETIFRGLGEFEVYKHTFQHPEDWCADCPIRFRTLLHINVLDPWPARIEKDRVIFEDTMEGDYLYAYKVVAYHRNGAASEDSNIALWPNRDIDESSTEPLPKVKGQSVR